MKIEFLIIVNKDGSFCENEEAFISFLKVDSKIEISGNTVKFNSSKSGDKFHVEFSLTSNEVKEKNERYFLLTLERKEETRIDEFSELSRLIKKNTEKINPGKLKINTLWDDVSLNYALKAYPLISNVENLMRKLISKFMLINVGMDWSKSAIDGELRKKIDSKKEEVDIHFDDVYRLDFIQLSEILFTKYRSADINYIDKHISSASKDEDLKLDSLKKFLPISNWERYFSSFIKYDEEKLKESWKKLYGFRNKVAHNRGITKSEYENIKKLVIDVEEVLNKALLNLNEIKLKPDDKDNIVKQSDGLINYSSAFSKAINEQIVLNNYKYFNDINLNYDKTSFENAMNSSKLFEAFEKNKKALDFLKIYFNYINNNDTKLEDDSDVE